MSQLSIEEVLHNSIQRWQTLAELDGFLPNVKGGWSEHGPLSPCYRFLMQEAFATDLKGLFFQAGLPTHDPRLLRARADLYWHSGFVRRARRLLALCRKIPVKGAQAAAKELAMAPLDLEVSRRAHLAVSVVQRHGFDFSQRAVYDFYENGALRGSFGIPMHVGIALLMVGGLAAAITLAADGNTSQTA